MELWNTIIPWKDQYFRVESINRGSGGHTHTFRGQRSLMFQRFLCISLPRPWQGGLSMRSMWPEFWMWNSQQALCIPVGGQEGSSLPKSIPRANELQGNEALLSGQQEIAQSSHFSLPCLTQKPCYSVEAVIFSIPVIEKMKHTLVKLSELCEHT